MESSEAEPNSEPLDFPLQDTIAATDATIENKQMAFFQDWRYFTFSIMFFCVRYYFFPV